MDKAMVQSKEMTEWVGEIKGRTDHGIREGDKGRTQHGIREGNKSRTEHGIREGDMDSVGTVLEATLRQK